MLIYFWFCLSGICVRKTQPTVRLLSVELKGDSLSFRQCAVFFLEGFRLALRTEPFFRTFHFNIGDKKEMGGKDWKGINVAAFMDEKRAKKAGIFPIDKELLESIYYLSKKTGLNFQEIYQVFKRTADYSLLETYSNYKKIRHFKRGESRTTWEPNPLLKLVQKRINDNILSKYQRHPCNFGFSGGKIELAIKPHLNSRFIFSCDIRHAFTNTKASEVLASLRIYSFLENPWKCLDCDSNVKDFLKKGKRIAGIDNGIRVILPKGVPDIITQICTFPVGENCELVIPQGAPTSPILFDLVMRPVDEQLSHLVTLAGGVYTRYADNIFCSMENEIILKNLEEDILSIVRCAGRGPAFKKYYGVHKIRTRDFSKQACRMLGLNVISKEIYNTRTYKRRLRAIIFYLKKALENNDDIDHIIHLVNVLHGMMGFVQRENLTPSIEREYQEVLKLMSDVM